MLFLLSVFQLIASTQSATINVVCSVVLAERFSSDEFTHEINVNRLNSSLSGIFLPACTGDKCGDDKINLKLDSVSWIFRIEILLHCDLFYLVAKRWSDIEVLLSEIRSQHKKTSCHILIIIDLMFMMGRKISESQTNWIGAEMLFLRAPHWADEFALCSVSGKVLYSWFFIEISWYAKHIKQLRILKMVWGEKLADTDILRLPSSN